MTLTKQEQRLILEIEQWEETFFLHEPTDFETMYQKWLNVGLDQIGKDKKSKVLETIDNFLFHLHAMIQNSRFHEDARERILEQAKVFNAEIEEVQDIRTLSIEKLNFMAKQQMAKQRLMSMGQGGVSGMGGILLLGIDLPAMIAINMRAIQLIGLSYGYDVKRPAEMMVAIKIFHVASLPKNLQAGAWDALWEEVQSEDYDEWFYTGNEEVADISWIQQPLRQLIKVMMIMLLRKKLIQGVPLIGMVFGATMNYQFSRQVTEVAQRFYQKRLLIEKG
ncbi:ABC transporter substrate-binding protein [Alkalihalophilus pseudofirmus]|uniref:EcsC family protein n=1 Tax=Alkalihalobacterium alkalinitrilicum TaxID=427920 RepID=UPI00094C06DC|nr:EcsC family protein [Alkalihalobacterium alkalinitrilicum]OLO40248.1 ABC transporter substrate-binding protein [Alkalihalophilus pseudofirmus]